MERGVRRGKTYNQLNGLCCGFIIPLSCENRPLAGESCMEFRGLCLTGWLQFQQLLRICWFYKILLLFLLFPIHNKKQRFWGWMADAVDEYCLLGWLVGWWILWFLWNMVQITGNHFDYCFYMCLVVCSRGCVPNHLINGRPTSKWGLLFWHAFRSRTMLNHPFRGWPFYNCSLLLGFRERERERE